jgi:hypothetical protein
MTITMAVKPGKQFIVVMATWQKRKHTTGSKRGKMCCTDKCFMIIQDEMTDTTTSQNIDPSS